MRWILAVAILAATAVPLAASATETITYIYDKRGRLIQVIHAGNNTVKVTYTYDKAGNRTKVTTTGAPR